MVGLLFPCHRVFHLKIWNCAALKFARKNKIETHAKEPDGTIAKSPLSTPKRHLQEGGVPNNGKNNKNNNNKNNNGNNKNNNGNNKNNKNNKNNTKGPKETKAPTELKTSKPSGKEFSVLIHFSFLSSVSLIHFTDIK